MTLREQMYLPDGQLNPALKNNAWIKQSFILTASDVDDHTMARRVISTANFKFTDTTLGGNFAINPPPQFTRFADIKTGGLAKGSLAVARTSDTRKRTYGVRQPHGGSSGWLGSNTMDSTVISGTRSHGMGRFYSEGIDDNGQNIVMRFGIPKYNSLAGFFFNFYDHRAAILVNAGRGDSIMFSAGKLLGAVVAFPFQPLIFAAKIYNFLSKAPVSKFYYSNPAMPLYWNAVNTIANGIAVNMGIIPPLFTAPQKEMMYGAERSPNPSQYNQVLHSLLPDIYSNKGGIDVYSMAGRAERLARYYGEQTDEKMKNAGNLNDLKNIALGLLQDLTTGPATGKVTRGGGTAAVGTVTPFDDYIKAWISLYKTGSNNENETTTFMTKDLSEFDQVEGNKAPQEALDALRGDGGATVTTDSGEPVDGAEPTADDIFIGSVTNSIVETTKSFFEYYRGELTDGTNFVTFRVDYNGESSESFSNSTGESALAGKLNSMSAQARETRFDLAGGNLAGGTFITDAIQDALGSVRDVLSGALVGAKMGGLLAMTGEAMVDIPKHWTGSSVQLPSANFTIQLRSPYGNKLSRFQNLMVPLSMILAAALPRSTGRHSYTSPFLTELYCRGRNVIRLGIIDSLTISRGQGNIGWTPEGEPLGIDVSFSVQDLSTMLHMPVSAYYDTWSKAALGTATAVAGLTGMDAEKLKDRAASAVSAVYDDDNSYTDYLAVLGSLGFQDITYVSHQWRLNRTFQRAQFNSWRSPAHMANWVGGTLPGRVLNALAVNTARDN